MCRRVMESAINDLTLSRGSTPCRRTQGLIECCCTIEHIAHVGDMRDIPTIQILVEMRRIHEHGFHISHA